MGAYTCQFGLVHKTCRCRTPHTIACDNVEEHEPNKKATAAVKFRLLGLKDSVFKDQRSQGDTYWECDRCYSVVTNIKKHKKVCRNA